MSGHSKFANIKHKKEKNDAAKGKMFTIIGREIAVAVKEGGADPNNNSKLRDVIAKAKANNMPNDTIERGIKKAAGECKLQLTMKQLHMKDMVLMVLQLLLMHLQTTRNRTAANVRNCIYKGWWKCRNTGLCSHICSMKRDRLSLIRKNVIWILMNL